VARGPKTPNFEEKVIDCETRLLELEAENLMLRKQVEKYSDIEAKTEIQPLVKLTKDLRNASRTLSPQEARYLVDRYYQIQQYRTSAKNQIRAGEGEEPNEVIVWFADNFEELEKSIKKALDAYTSSHPIGVWCKSIIGIGPTFAAGLLAHIDAKKAPTAGAVWSYAGYNPSVEWLKGQKRPWNADLKKLGYLIGESFCKVQNNPNDVYGKLYKQRKIQEIEKNINGDFAEQAQAKLIKFKIGKETDAYKWYAGCLSSKDAQAILLGEKTGKLKDLIKEAGSGTQMLPPAHINERSKRYAVKLFLAHYHEIAYEFEFGIKPPNPYAISILGHAHKLEVPNYEIFKEALENNPAL
jgi:hypothetical protein